MPEYPLDILWTKVLDSLRNRLGNSRAFHIWIEPAKPVSLEGNVLTIEMPNPSFQKGFLSFAEVVKEAFQDVAGFLPEIQYFNATHGEEERKTGGGPAFNVDYTFENFVVGPCNRLAHAAALAVAHSPGTAYNPLFFHGGVGLGKTHLIQAIGSLVQRRENLHITYLPCEFFVNLFIQSIQNKSINAFRARFRNLDYLLIDDIHFIAGKEGTQEEFFHTFNALYDQRKQIILSSDRPPKEIASLEKRLLSRFEWGLVVDLQPPDFETRVAILKKKCDLRRLVLPDDVTFYICENIRDNVRLLEGVMNRLVAYSSLLNRQVDLPLAQEIVQGMYTREEKPVTIELILKKVGEFFHLTPGDIKAKTRKKYIVVPRQIAMYLAREMTHASLPFIAEEFGGKDHSTVLHSCKKIKKEIEQDDHIKNIVERIKKDLHD